MMWNVIRTVLTRITTGAPKVRKDATMSTRHMGTEFHLVSIFYSYVEIFFLTAIDVYEGTKF